jgi:hypothetical protein
MSHNTHVRDNVNKDDIKIFDSQQTIAYYLNLVKNWKDPFPEPVVVNHEGFNVVREDLLGIGAKGRFGDFLVSRAQSDTVVYVQPRFGFAGVSLSYLCKMYGKKLVLFMPSSKEISHHQRYCIEQGCTPKFRRIAAMPNLNLEAKQWAEDNGAYFVPMGLNHTYVTACIVKTAYEMSVRLGYQPRKVWCAISTGVLCRGLQIAWPSAEFCSIAVARNLKAGELGRSEVISSPYPFAQETKILPPFPSAKNYDAKVWEYMKLYGQEGDWMFNVASEVECLTNNLTMPVDSYRNWGEIRDTI